MMFSFVSLIAIPTACSEDWTEGWRKLPAGYVIEAPVLAASWDWGRRVMIEAMAEHEELVVTRGKVSELSQQIEAIRVDLKNQMDPLRFEVKEQVEQAYADGYKKGARKSGVTWALIGLGLGLLAGSN